MVRGLKVLRITTTGRLFYTTTFLLYNLIMIDRSLVHELAVEYIRHLDIEVNK